VCEITSVSKYISTNTRMRKIMSNMILSIRIICLAPKWLLLFTSALAAYDRDRISTYIFGAGVIVLIALIIDILTLPVPYKIMDVIAIGIYFMILDKARKCRI